MSSRLEPKPEDKVTSDIRVDVIIPTLNEEETIGNILSDISKLRLPLTISPLVIDGGSLDSTIEVCKNAKARVIRQKGKGKGRAMREAVENSDADIIVFIDGDGTYSVQDLEHLIQPLLAGEADMVVGSRLAGKREKGSITSLNTMGNKLFNKTINFAMKSNITDSLSGYRAIFRKTFMEFILFSDSFEIEVEMMVEALGKRYRVVEVPISYGKRIKGSNTKLNPFDDGFKIARTLLFILMNMNPLKFFGIFSLIFIVLGLYPGILVLYEKIATGNIVSMPAVVLSSLLFVSAAICLVIGILSELVVASRRRLEALVMRKY